MQTGMKYAVIVVPLLIAFAVSAVSGHFLIPFLRRVKAGQTERTDGPQSHLKKTGTPNMGGIMIILGLAAASLCMAPRCPEVLPVLFLTVGFGVVGFIDDYLKVVKKKSDGLNPKQKMALQIVIALLFALYVTRFHSIDLAMKVPFMAGGYFDLKFLNIPALLFIAVASHFQRASRQSIHGRYGLIGPGRICDRNGLYAAAASVHPDCRIHLFH